jgi:nicotinate-nucleotide pyrophosphorylase (carboxylating)
MSHPDELPPPATYDALIERALAEDHVTEDVTTAALVDPAATGTAQVTVKAPGVICGLPLIAAVMARVDPGVEVTLLSGDGDTVGAGTVVAQLSGPLGALLRGERTVLNFLQRLSGVATKTASFVEGTMATGVGIYDTRKTTPGWRALEKYAVRCGGGHNHRMDLADAAMIKENHLRAAYGETGPGAIARGVAALLAKMASGVTIYVEAETQAELEAAVQAAGPEAGRLVVMLDDFAFEDIRRAVLWVRQQPRPHPQLEVTGGVTVDRVEGLSATGVSRLSTGSVTHSAPALDISLKIT